MPPLESLMAPRSRATGKALGPKTPEPFSEIETRPPSPPRPRFRLRKRNASNLNAPTQQFLASVAAADVPIPSIEEPRSVDEDMVDTLSTSFPRFNPYDFEFVDVDEKPRGRAFSPPKTPAPRTVPSLSPKRFPDWSLDQAYSSLESSPECESSRPSTAHSTQTSASLFSRYSFNSDNFSQYSIEADDEDQPDDAVPAEDANKTIRAPHVVSKKRSRKAPWTRPMSHHLWTTYMTYLQDPHVTPFRIGKSGIPPHGVCMRVAREAKRSWKGSRAQTKTDKSGSATPTIEAPTAFIQWPHSCAATRAHLRELCKASTATTTRNHHYIGNSPTPFGKAATRFWNRRSAPLRSPSVFAGNDMALSLAMSTCESMQPNGPLAQITGSQLGPTAEEVHPTTFAEAANMDIANDDVRLGSPFMARSYGPSSSNALRDSFGANPEPQRLSRTVGTRRRSLGSPARLGGSRNSTQKRRSRQSGLDLRRSKRPSFGSDFWVDPSKTSGGPSQAVAPSTEFSSSASNQRDNLFIPRTNLQELFEASHPASSVAEGTPLSTRTPTFLAPHVAEAPARLGSPFSGNKASFSFPSRRSVSISAIDFGAIRRPFATVQQPSDAETIPTKSSLRSRLAYIDERLKDFRSRDQPRRRSQSPS